MRKRLMMLGGSSTQLPAIQYAKKQGHYLILCDYLQDNPGQFLVDRFYNISTTDLDAVLETARAECIDGIVAYASEPAAPTAAYVAEKLHLPCNPYKSVLVLSTKDQYRAFLKNNNFNTPQSYACSKVEDLCRIADKLKYPFITKPVDSSGSKGVTVVKTKNGIFDAFNHAIQYSRAKRVIAEELVGKIGEQLIGEGFVCNGELIFCMIGQHYFDLSCNPLVPSGGCFSSNYFSEEYKDIENELKRLLKILGIKMGALNLEFKLDKDGKVYLMEIAPRNGGNMIPQLMFYATGFDMIKYTVDSSLGYDCHSKLRHKKMNYFSYYVIHSQLSGKLNSLNMTSTVKNNIIASNIWVKKGENVNAFNNASDALGVLLLKFNNQHEMNTLMYEMSSHVTVNII